MSTQFDKNRESKGILATIRGFLEPIRNLFRSGEEIARIERENAKKAQKDWNAKHLILPAIKVKQFGEEFPTDEEMEESEKLDRHIKSMTSEDEEDYEDPLIFSDHKNNTEKLNEKVQNKGNNPDSPEPSDDNQPTPPPTRPRSKSSP